jgi:hypothetical protein
MQTEISLDTVPKRCKTEGANDVNTELTLPL